MEKVQAAAISTFAVLAAALVGGRNAPSPANARGAAWYVTLDKPFYTPSGSVFGIAWTLLYALLGWAGYRLLSARPDPKRSEAITLWGLNVAGVALHPYVLFGRRDLRSSTVLVTAESAAALTLVAAAWRVDQKAAVSQVPLALWTCFADLLNEELWRRNRASGR